MSGNEITKWIPNVNLLRYSEFKKSDKLPRLPIIILYETKPDFGHWVLITKTPEGIEHFDSYGYEPDGEFEFIPEHFKKESNQDYKYLLHILSKRDDVNYNQYKFQQDGDIATCGRWCIFRHMFNTLTTDQFANMVIKTSKQLQITPDQLVCIVV